MQASGGPCGRQKPMQQAQQSDKIDEDFVLVESRRLLSTFLPVLHQENLKDFKNE